MPRGHAQKPSSVGLELPSNMAKDVPCLCFRTYRPAYPAHSGWPTRAISIAARCPVKFTRLCPLAVIPRTFLS
jgi:hypothetical protein